jgi:hypothetical protein
MRDERRWRGVRVGGLVVVLAVVVWLPACGVPLPATPAPAAGVPGFDTRDYPGDAARATGRASSPYRWVGFYLPAPCFTGTGWQGTRSRLQQAGWGLAVLFVGEQDWEQILPAGQVIRDPSAVRCVQANLRADKGLIDAAAAASEAGREGFPPGTAIYLNVERVERVTQDLRAYVRAWVSGLLQEGRFEPALYAHARNAAELHALYRQEFARVGRAGEPRLWVARTGGFDLTRSPTDSGFPEANIWQGVLDTRETWGGVTLPVDVNVARTADPSG